METLRQQSPEVLVGSVVVTALVAMQLSYMARSPRKMRTTIFPDGTEVVLPPHLTSWIPYVGSAVEMGTGIVDFIRSKAQKLNSPIFTATILGDKCIFLGDPELQMLLFRPKYKKFLDGFFLQKQFMKRVVKMTDEEIQESFVPSITKISAPQYLHFLFKGQELERSMGRVQDYFTRNLPKLAASETEWTRHPMYETVLAAVFSATMGPFLSDAMVDDEAKLEAFRDFEKGVVPLFNNAPHFLTSKARAARDMLTEFVSSESFWERASPLLKERRATLPLSKSAFSKGNFGLVFAAVANSAPAVFWAVVHLMQDPAAWMACREQLDVVLAKKGNQSSTPDQARFTLDDLDELTLLDSAFWETLRLHQANFTIRKVTQEFTVEHNGRSYLFQEGLRIMAYWPVLHHDPDIFENPLEFRYDRFVKKQEFFLKNGKKINYFPVVAFGGGEHLCPGRKFIAYEAKLYLAMLMLNFDMRLAEGETIPGIDLANQGLGVSHPDKEIHFEVRKRRST